MKRKIIFYLTLLMLSIMSAGCWDMLDISERGFISAIGLDKADNPLAATGEIPYRYKVTAEILVPTLAKEASWRLKKENDKASVIYTAEGETIEKALNIIQTSVPLELSLTHLNVLIIGEELAQEGFKNSLNFFERYPEVARRLYVLQAQNSEARDILRLKPQFFRFNATELISLDTAQSAISHIKTETLSDFLREMRINNGVSLGTRIIISEEDCSTLHGASVIKDWKLIGWLNKDETRHANWLKGEGRTTVVGQLDEGIITYQVDDRKLKILSKVENSTISFTVDLRVRGCVCQEEQSSLDLMDTKNVLRTEDLFSKVIKKEIEDALHKAQKDFQADYLGFGMKLMNKHPQIYKSLDWEKTFPNVPIDVQVKTELCRFGLIR